MADLRVCFFGFTLAMPFIPSESMGGDFDEITLFGLSPPPIPWLVLLLHPSTYTFGVGLQLSRDLFSGDSTQVHTYGLGSFHGRPRRPAASPTPFFGALIAVVGPSRFETLAFARTNIRNRTARTSKQAVNVGDDERKLEGNSSEQESMAVNLKLPALLNLTPPQSKIRNAMFLFPFPTIKPSNDFIGNKPPRTVEILLGDLSITRTLTPIPNWGRSITALSNLHAFACIRPR
jgi:hypothetical protein